MYLEGTIILVLITSLAVIVIKKRNKNKTRDSYGIHLGEMTKHDVPGKYPERKELKNEKQRKSKLLKNKQYR